MSHKSYRKRVSVFAVVLFVGLRAAAVFADGAKAATDANRDKDMWEFTPGSIYIGGPAHVSAEFSAYTNGDGTQVGLRGSAEAGYQGMVGTEGKEYGSPTYYKHGFLFTPEARITVDAKKDKGGPFEKPMVREVSGRLLAPYSFSWQFKHDPLPSTIETAEARVKELKEYLKTQPERIKELEKQLAESNKVDERYRAQTIKTVSDNLAAEKSRNFKSEIAAAEKELAELRKKAKSNTHATVQVNLGELGGVYRDYSETGTKQYGGTGRLVRLSFDAVGKINGVVPFGICGDVTPAGGMVGRFEKTFPEGDNRTGLGPTRGFGEAMLCLKAGLGEAVTIMDKGQVVTDYDSMYVIRNTVQGDFINRVGVGYTTEYEKGPLGNAIRHLGTVSVQVD